MLFSTSDILKISFVQLCDISIYFDKHLLSVFGPEAGDRKMNKTQLLSLRSGEDRQVNGI